MSEGTLASSSTTSFLINSRVLSELVEDGLLIDIRVTGTTKLEWNRVLEFLHTSDLTDRTNQTIEDQEHLDTGTKRGLLRQGPTTKAHERNSALVKQNEQADRDDAEP